jgi:hypothetical protein
VIGKSGLTDTALGGIRDEQGNVVYEGGGRQGALQGWLGLSQNAALRLMQDAGYTYATKMVIAENGTRREEFSHWINTPGISRETMEALARTNREAYNIYKAAADNMNVQSNIQPLEDVEASTEGLQGGQRNTVLKLLDMYGQFQLEKARQNAILTAELGAWIGRGIKGLTSLLRGHETASPAVDVIEQEAATQPAPSSNVNNIGRIGNDYRGFLMQNEDWADKSLIKDARDGTEPTIGGVGCKLVAAAQMISTILGRRITPDTLVDEGVTDAKGNTSQTAIQKYLTDNGKTVDIDDWEKQLNAAKLNEIKNGASKTYILGRMKLAGDKDRPHWVMIEDFSVGADGVITYTVVGSSDNDATRTFNSAPGTTTAHGQIFRIETYTPR